MKSRSRRNRLPKLLLTILSSITFALFVFESVRSSALSSKYERGSTFPVCDSRFKREHTPQAKSSSHDISLNVSHLNSRYRNTGGWLSQKGEDRWLYDHFFELKPALQPRIFVELGALDGLQFSNTYIFEKAFQWKGVLIEGITENFVALERNRGGTETLTIHSAACNPGNIVALHGIGPAAGVKAKSEATSLVPCVRLDDVLRGADVKQVDLLSLDVEGAELDVLETLNFHRIPIFVILVEMRSADEESNPRIRRHLHRNGFCLFAVDVGHSNEVWVNRNFRHSAAAFHDTPMKKSSNKSSEDLACEPFLGMPSRLWLRLPASGAYNKLPCDVHLGARPKTHTVNIMGSTCEPWMTRCAISALDRVLKPSMHGLEWSCGSGTLWYLQRLASLSSIEHNSGWFRDCEEAVQRMGSQAVKKWTGHLVPLGGVSKALVHESAPHKTEESYKLEQYVNQASQLQRKVFDFIVIDGRSRSACLEHVLRTGLIRAQDGVLVLDNSERAKYQEAIKHMPEHWHRYDFVTAVDTTTIWITQKF